jgi:hypothetical protein
MRVKPLKLAKLFDEGTIRLGEDGKTRFVAKKGPKNENRWYRIRAQETEAEDISRASKPKESASEFKPGTIRKGKNNHIKFIVKIDSTNNEHYWYRIRTKQKRQK